MSQMPPPPSDLHVGIFRYWSQRRDSRVMPVRADIDPFDLKPYLPHIMLLDATQTHFRYRLVGSRIVQDFGRDTTGSIAGSHVSTQDYADALTGAFARVRDLGQGVFTIGDYRTPGGLRHSVSRLILPLGAPGHVNMLLVSRIARSPSDTPKTDWLGQARGSLSHMVPVATAEDVAVECAEWEAMTAPAALTASHPSERLLAAC